MQGWVEWPVQKLLFLLWILSGPRCHAELVVLGAAERAQRVFERVVWRSGLAHVRLIPKGCDVKLRLLVEGNRRHRPPVDVQAEWRADSCGTARPMDLLLTGVHVLDRLKQRVDLRFLIVYRILCVLNQRCAQDGVLLM